MSALPQISEAEFEVMKIVWESAPINTNEITERLLKTTSWSAKTIHTLIKRLVTKGALTYEKQGRIFVYTPLVDETEYINHQSSSFLNRFLRRRHQCNAIILYRKQPIIRNRTSAFTFHSIQKSVAVRSQGCMVLSHGQPYSALLQNLRSRRGIL